MQKNILINSEWHSFSAIGLLIPLQQFVSQMTTFYKSPTFAKQKYPSRATEYNNLFRKWPLLKNRKRSRVSLIPLNNIKSTEAPVHCKSIQNILVICETNCCMSRRVPVDPLRSPIFSPTSADWISSSQSLVHILPVYVIYMYYCNDTE